MWNDRKLGRWGGERGRVLFRVGGLVEAVGDGGEFGLGLGEVVRSGAELSGEGGVGWVGFDAGVFGADDGGWSGDGAGLAGLVGFGGSGFGVPDDVGGGRGGVEL